MRPCAGSIYVDPPFERGGGEDDLKVFWEGFRI